MDCCYLQAFHQFTGCMLVTRFRCVPTTWSPASLSGRLSTSLWCCRQKQGKTAGSADTLGQDNLVVMLAPGLAVPTVCNGGTKTAKRAVLMVALPKLFACKGGNSNAGGGSKLRQSDSPKRCGAVLRHLSLFQEWLSCRCIVFSSLQAMQTAIHPGYSRPFLP